LETVSAPLDAQLKALGLPVPGQLTTLLWCCWPMSARDPPTGLPLRGKASQNPLNRSAVTKLVRRKSFPNSCQRCYITTKNLQKTVISNLLVGLNIDFAFCGAGWQHHSPNPIPPVLVVGTPVGMVWTGLGLSPQTKGSCPRSPDCSPPSCGHEMTGRPAFSQPTFGGASSGEPSRYLTGDGADSQMW
jgi:hypothetical protein